MRLLLLLVLAVLVLVVVGVWGDTTESDSGEGGMIYLGSDNEKDEEPSSWESQEQPSPHEFVTRLSLFFAFPFFLLPS